MIRVSTRLKKKFRNFSFKHRLSVELTIVPGDWSQTKNFTVKVLSKIKYLLMARFRNFENMLRIFAFHEKVNWIYFRENIFLFDGSIQKHSFCPFSSFFKICVWLSSFYKLKVRFECNRVQQNTVRYAGNVFSENRSIGAPYKNFSLSLSSAEPSVL